jgi:lipid II:glycine glycyltransferase (peptidoglycan interpeptide bridge formation enzyme)
MATTDIPTWDAFIALQPDAHLLQTSMWGELKDKFNWQPERVVSGNSGTQILFRTLPLGFTMAYIPKGPVGTDWVALWPRVHAVCRNNRAIFLRVEPDLEDNTELNIPDLLPGFVPVGDTIQPRQTIYIDISGSPEDWLARMKQKARYNTRLAEKKDVSVIECEDFEAFDQLMKATGNRDGFGVHSIDYYRTAYRLFRKKGKVALLQAAYEGKPLAMLMVFAQGKRAYYLYGASGDEERQRMPTYLLQLEAMKWASRMGCIEYDLWGIPDAPEEELEANFETRSDGLWGVYRFKRGLGGRIYRSCPGYDYIYQPQLYRIIRWQMLRSRGLAGG